MPPTALLIMTNQLNLSQLGLADYAYHIIKSVLILESFLLWLVQKMGANLLLKENMLRVVICLPFLEI